MDDYPVLPDDEQGYMPEAAHWWAPGSLLSSGTSAITALVLAYSGLGNWLGFPVAEALLGFPEGPYDIRNRALVSASVSLLILIGAFWLSNRVFVDDDDEMPQWVRHVAGSAVVIAVVGTVLSVLTIAGSLLGPSSSGTGGRF